MTAEDLGIPQYPDTEEATPGKVDFKLVLWMRKASNIMSAPALTKSRCGNQAEGLNALTTTNSMS